MNSKMTPCEKLGYKVGDEFEVISHHAFKNGQVVTLHEDDGTECPLFSGDGGGAGVFDGVECSFATLNEQVRKIANKLKPAKQALADAINQNGGLVEGGDWHKKGELPPVGEICEIHHSCWNESKFEKVKIAAITKDYLIVEYATFEQHYLRKDMSFRSLRTERDRAIDEIVSEFIDHYGDPKGGERYLGIAEKLYDAGYRKEVKQ